MSPPRLPLCVADVVLSSGSSGDEVIVLGGAPGSSFASANAGSRALLWCPGLLPGLVRDHARPAKLRGFPPGDRAGLFGRQ